MHRMIYQKHIKIIIMVVIKKYRLRVKTFRIQSILLCFFCKSQVAIINEKFISAMKTFVPAHFTNINIQQPVSIYIGNSYTCFPITFSLYACFKRNIFKFEIPFIQVKFIAFPVRRKINIRKPVAVKISDRNTAPIIIVEIIKDIK